ncbi:tetratricopeptide repeat protein [Spirulina subsalsa FACHB-351]|uniref:Tetratricopeptide repeat protein n=1 Tax=Spirulina subsalsa FACHB-351 TaxID=234711 RepID=A0ABT3L5J5_9CYAN|nr:CHAT domain-containing protein [Spirulina subsalsa]MCW6036772.1 tetratricopeptide repeat protein [Spirulina subsalsa FACHB-351]
MKRWGWLLVGGVLLWESGVNRAEVRGATVEIAQTPLEEAEQLNQQVIQLYQAGNYEAAIPLMERVLTLRQQVLGTQHPDVANSLNNLAFLYEAQGRYSEAEPLYLQALESRKRLWGTEHPDVATSLNNLAGLYSSQGRYSEAESLYLQALEIRKHLLGEEHPTVATSLNNLAFLYTSQGRYSEAEPLYLQALELYKRLLGEEHPELAATLNNLAFLYSSQGRYAEAEPLYLQALELYKLLFGAEDPNLADSLNNLAGLYLSQGRYLEAEPLYLQALGMRKHQFGVEHPSVAQSLNNLAILYSSQGRYAEAEPLYLQALEMRKRLLGVEHPSVADSLNNLAELYRFQGRYPEAEPLYLQALEMRKRQFGVEHSLVAQSLHNLAGLYESQGRYSEAEPLYFQALEINQRLLGTEHGSVATSLNNLATLYYAQGRYPEAEPLLRQALEIRERLWGKEHPDVATSLNNLAELYRSQGRYRDAQPLYIQVLEMRKRLFATEHPSLATSLNNLAFLYLLQERYPAAEPLFHQALEMRKQLLGEQHPDIAASLNNLALLHQSQGDVTNAVNFLRQGLDIEEHNLDTILATGSESQKQDYMNTLRGTTQSAISLHLQTAPNDPEAANLAFTTLLRRKGRILEAVTNNLQTLRQNLTPANQKLLDNLTRTRSQLAALTFNPPENLPPEQYRQQLSQLQNQANELEVQLARNSAEFRQQTASVTIEAIQALIPRDAALIELVVYRPFHPKAPPGEQWGEPHYGAYLLQSSGPPQWVDLGRAEPIDALRVRVHRDLTNSARRPENSLKPNARQLDEMVMQPIRAQLGNTKQLLISPDGQLNLLPFAALVDENGQYLVENYSITYLTTGRDLIRFQEYLPSQNPPLILANPDYRQADSLSIVASRGRGDTQRSLDLGKLTFAALPYTEVEGKALQNLLPEAVVLMGDEATENVLQQTPSPRMLHLATHGFFLPDIASRELAVPQSFSGLLSREAPLLRSGLALAGFNERRSGGEDGVLTALEVAGLNLWGTQLVVLSACETGIGEVNNGEGVYGLRRALVMAGSESQVMSLWKVSDEGTKDFMVEYYERVLRGEGRGEALRQVQLGMLRGDRYGHPYYWAAFIPSGDWREMGD